MVFHTTINEIDLSNLRDYTPDDFCKLVEGLGFSEEGMQAIRSNLISGVWFGEFDENDIKDLFSEFKDRFLARKILTRFRTQVNDPSVQQLSSATTTTTGATATTTAAATSLSSPSLTDFHQYQSANSNGSTHSASTGSQRRKAFKRDHITIHNRLSPHYSQHSNHRNSSSSIYNNGFNMSKYLTPEEEEIVDYCEEAYEHENGDATNGTGLNGFTDVKHEQDGHNESEDDVAGNADSDSPPLPVGEDDSAGLMNILNNLNYDEETEEYAASGSPVFLYPCPYSFDDLLERKPKTGSATPATHYFLAVLRQAATETGLWGPAPPMKDIPPTQRDSFIAAMAKRVPGIESFQSEIFKRLAMALQNRRKYKRERRRINAAKKRPFDQTETSGESFLVE